MPDNYVMALSEGLKTINVGGLTVTKKRGRGRNPPPEIHAGKGSMLFRPQFTEKYVVELIINESKKEEAIRIIRENVKRGKIFTTPITDAIDIATGEKEGVI